MPDPYAYGTQSAQIRALQAALALAGFYPGAIDGIFGRLTAIAVRTAQERHALPPTGRVDAGVLAALGLSRPASSNPLADWIFGLALREAFNQLKRLPNMEFLSGYKTYIVAGAMLIAGIAGLLGVDIPSFSGQAPGTLVMEALAFFFMRQGLKSDATKG